jgi:hypothetical protein
MALNGTFTEMAYQEPLATTTRPGVMQVGTGLSVLNGIVSTSGGGLAVGYFYDTSTQTNPVGNAINIVGFNSTSISSGISMVGGSEITVAVGGTFNLQFTFQFDKTDAGTDIADVWLRRNGLDVADSKTTLSLVFNNAVLLAGWSYLISLNPGDNLQLVWTSLDVNLRLLTVPAQVGPPAQPVSPSARAVLIQV